MSLFDTIPGPDPARFAGDAYEPERDDARLKRQIDRVYGAMADGRWRTLEAIHRITGDPQPSILAQLGHLRKERFGSYLVERRAVEGAPGLHEYRVGGKGEGTPKTRKTPAHETALRVADEMVTYLQHTSACIRTAPFGDPNGCICGLTELRRQWTTARQETRR